MENLWKSTETYGNLQEIMGLWWFYGGWNHFNDFKRSILQGSIVVWCFDIGFMLTFQEHDGNEKGYSGQIIAANMMPV